MGEIVISEQIYLACSPAHAFELIAEHGLPGWQLPLGRRLQAGVPIRIPLAFPPSLGLPETDILGRIVQIQHPYQLVVTHELPWRGTIRIKVRPASDGTCSLLLIGSVDEDLVSWATRLSSPAIRSARTGRTWPLGLLSSASGPASVFSVATRNMATLAVEEINEAGGILGHHIELVHGDDGSHPGLGAAELVRLKAAGCNVVFANVTSATFQKLLPVARRHGILLLFTLMNEGGSPREDAFRFGERPMAQATAAIPALMEATGGARFYLAGSDYCWPRTMMRAAKKVIGNAGGSIGSETYLPLGTNDFTDLIESIDRHKTELVLSTFVGADEVAFEQQMHSAGLGERVQTVSFVLDESTHEYIGPQASSGLWTVFSYFETLQSEANSRFLSNYHHRFGADAPPVSSLTECVYEAVHLVARAAMAAGDLEPSAVRRALGDGVSFHGPRGKVEASAQGLRQPMFLARSVNGRLEALDQKDAACG